MTDDWLDQLEAGLVRLQDGYCVASDLEVAAAAAIQKLRAELAAERENTQQARELASIRGLEAAGLSAERAELRALLREARNFMPFYTEELRARINAALKGDGKD